MASFNKLKVQSAPQVLNRKFALFHFKSRTVATIPPKTFSEAESTTRHLFNIPETQNVIIQAKFDGELAEIDPRLFPSIYNTLDKYWVSVADIADGSHSVVISPVLEVPQVPPAPLVKLITLNFTSQLAEYRPISFRVNPDLPFSNVFQPLASQTQAAPGASFLLSRNGETIEPTATPRSLDVKSGETITFGNLLLKRRKPVIYLFPPQGVTLQASVQLTISSEWRFSALYPSASIKIVDRNMQRVQWDVTVHPTGDITDKSGGTDVSYLFWEADAVQNAVSTPPCSPVENKVAPFNPNKTTLSPEDSVLMPTEAVPTYLDKELIALGMHTEARTAFITFWLPYMLKYKHIALCFLNQESFSAAAPLNITPTPDVVIRVFMLFQGVQTENLHFWESRMQIEDVNWKHVLNVSSPELMHDKDIFRVLEWGGMEVNS